MYVPLGVRALVHPIFTLAHFLPVFPRLFCNLVYHRPTTPICVVFLGGGNPPEPPFGEQPPSTPETRVRPRLRADKPHNAVNHRHSSERKTN